MTSSTLDRKSIWFHRTVWLMLDALSQLSGAASPSIMVEPLVRDAYANRTRNDELKGSANGRTAVPR